MEELQLILSTLQAAGDGAFTFGIIYLVYDMLGLLLLLAFLTVAGKYVITKSIYVSEANTRLEAIRDALEVGTPGATSSYEYTEILTKINDLMRK